MKLRICICFVIIWFFNIGLNAQGGWTRALDGYFVQLSTSFFSSTEFYDVEGLKTDLDNKFSSQNILLYAEYGVTDRLDMLLNMPLLKLQKYDITQTAIGPGDLRIGFKYAILKNAFPLAFSFEAEIPTSSGEKIVPFSDPNRTGNLFNLPTGDGEYNYWMTLVGSKSNGKGDLYASLYGAVNMRTKGFSNQLQLGGEIGKQLGPVWLIAKLKIQDKLGSNEFTDSVFLFGEQTTYTEYNLTGFYKISDQISMTASYQGYASWLKSLNNVSIGPSFNIGVSIEH